MSQWISRMVLLAVPLLLLGACVGRTILSGSHKTHKPVSRTTASKTISVWFVKPDGSNLSLISVGRKPASSDRLTAAVQELLEGPSSAEEHTGLGTEIPRGTILLGVKPTGSGVELNLSRRFATGGGTSSFETRLEQLRRTVDSAAETPVYLSVEGKRLTISEGEGIEIRQPINR